MDRVVAAVIVQDERTLVARRGPGERHEGYWEFPGGKLEKDERPEDALVRELKEEFGIDIEVEAPFHRIRHDYGDGPFELTAYKARWLGGRIRLVVHDAHAWVSPHELADHPLLEADRPLADALISTGAGHEPPSGEAQSA